MVICAVYRCGIRSERDKLRMFSIPAVITNQCDKTRELSSRRQALWLTRINRADLTSKNLGIHRRVCSKHFISGSPSGLFDDANPDWAPSLQLGHANELSDEKAQTARSRYQRAAALRERRASLQTERQVKKRKRFAVGNAECDVQCQDSAMDYNLASHPRSSVDVACQTDLECSLDLQEQYENTLQDNFALRRELCKLRDKVRLLSMDMDALENDEKKLKFYTGLPTFSLVMHVFNFVSSKVIESHRNKLSKFQEFILVLMRLRLNLLERDLAYRFGIAQSTVSVILDKWIRIMSCRLEKLIVWPEREILQATMPACFKTAFGNKVSVIIDCFEIFIKRSSSLLTRAETFSNYKKHNTVKFLIGISPQGTVSFISRGWVGRASDKCITENCGILNKLLPGDVVLADRGFDISEIVGMYRAKLHIPAFTKSRTQLPAEEVQDTRTIANVRIHVERVIGLVRRKFKILEGTLPIDILKKREGDSDSPVDYVVRVCCALANLCPSVVGRGEDDEEFEIGE